MCIQISNGGAETPPTDKAQAGGNSNAPTNVPTSFESTASSSSSEEPPQVPFPNSFGLPFALSAKWVSWSSPHSRDLLWAFDSHFSGFLFPQNPGRSIAFIMLSLIWTVFFVHVAIYLVNTIGASTVDNLVRYCSLSFFLNPPDRPSIIVNTANLPTNRSYYFPSSSYGFST